MLRIPVDPHKTDIQPKPRTEDDLFVNADGQWLTAYDNLSTLDQHWSDAFCRISTGSGYSKRKLYSDRDTATFQVARPRIITSSSTWRARRTCSIARSWRRCRS